MRVYTRTSRRSSGLSELPTPPVALPRPDAGRWPITRAVSGDREHPAPSIHRRGSHARLQSPAARHALPAQRSLRFPRALPQPGQRSRSHARHGRCDPRRMREALRGSDRPALPQRRRGRLPPGERRSTDAEGLQGSLRGLCRRRLAGPLAPGGVRWPGPADEPRRAQTGDDGHRQLAVLHVSRPLPRRDEHPDAARHRGTEADLPGSAHRGPLGRHHVPHRAAVRHRSRPGEDPRRGQPRR